MAPRTRMSTDALEPAVPQFYGTLVAAPWRNLSNQLLKASCPVRARTSGMREAVALIALLALLGANQARSQDRAGTVDAMLSQAVESENKQDYTNAERLN